MTKGVNHAQLHYSSSPGHRPRRLAASRELYQGLLGAEPTADTPYYVGFDVDGQQIGLVPGATVVRPRLHVPDMAGAEIGLIADPVTR